MILGIIFAIFIILGIIYYIAYSNIETNETLYWGFGCTPVKVINKTLFEVTISTFDGTFNISTLQFLLVSQKIS